MSQTHSCLFRYWIFHAALRVLIYMQWKERQVMFTIASLKCRHFERDTRKTTKFFHRRFSPLSMTSLPQNLTRECHTLFRHSLRRPWKIKVKQSPHRNSIARHIAEGKFSVIECQFIDGRRRMKFYDIPNNLKVNEKSFLSIKNNYWRLPV